MSKPDILIQSFEDRLAVLDLDPLQEQAVRKMLEEFAVLFDADKQITILGQHFGGSEKFREVAKQINTWAKDNLPTRVLEALSTTAEGVLCMHRMMVGERHNIIQLADTEATLKRLMRDPRYWRDQDPEIVERVREGFRKLYKD